MSGLSARLEKVERAVGIGEPCEACEAREAAWAWTVEHDRAWGIEPYNTDRAACIPSRCYWCGAAEYVSHNFTPAEAADFATLDGCFWRGDLCQHKALRASVLASIDRHTAKRYGEHADEVRANSEEYGEALRAIEKAPLPYLCRVPGCECEYPKTLTEWQKNVTANGYRGYLAAAN